MVALVDALDVVISDDPVIRRMQLVEVVLSHCAHVFWPQQPERMKQAKQWASELREAVSRCLSSRDSPRSDGEGSKMNRSVTPHKSGKNGCTVASADVIIRKAQGKNGTAEPLEKQSSHSAPAANGTEEKGERGTMAPAACSSPCTTESYFEKSGLSATAAVTLDGEVVMVTETGSPLNELKSSPGFPTSPLEIKRLSGGITNELFHIYDASAKGTPSVVVRVFGKETERVISRESELFYQSLFIPTYVRGVNFLIYHFLDGYDTLPYTDMAQEALLIAEGVAEFQVRATLASRHDRKQGSAAVSPAQGEGAEELMESVGEAIVQKKHSAAASSAAPNPAATARFERETNYTTHSLTKWVDLVTSAEIQEKVQEEKRADYNALARQLRESSEWMLTVLEREAPQLGEGVCHNDLLSANIMRKREGGDLMIIDFDYTKRNFLLFDIANHFNEYTGLDCDYATYFPGDAHMERFLAAYRAAMRATLLEVHQKKGDAMEEIIPNARALFWTESEAAEKEVVVYWTKLVKLLTLASHLSWSIWSLLQEAVSVLDVDFLDYAKLRYGRYAETRDAFSLGF